MSNFRPIDRDMDDLLPPSMNEWLPERHLARIEAQLKAEAADRADGPDGMSIPDGRARREERRARIAAANHDRGPGEGAARPRGGRR